MIFAPKSPLPEGKTTRGKAAKRINSLISRPCFQDHASQTMLSRPSFQDQDQDPRPSYQHHDVSSLARKSLLKSSLFATVHMLDAREHSRRATTFSRELEPNRWWRRMQESMTVNPLMSTASAAQKIKRGHSARVQPTTNLEHS